MRRRRSRPVSPIAAHLNLLPSSTERLESRALLSAVNVTVDKAAVLEDSNGVLLYTFTRDDPANALTVNFQISGSAVAGQDYFTSGATSFNGQVGTILFAAGQDSRVFLVSPADDPLVEPDEDVQVDIMSGSGYTIGTPARAGTQILNDDPSATVTLSTEPASVTEDGNGLLRYTFTRAGNTVTDLNVDFRVTGTAVAGQDYFTAGAKSFNGQFGTITIPTGQSSAVFLVSPADDSAIEPNETVKVELTPGRFYSNGTPGGVQAVILNDDPPSTVTIAVDSSAVLESGSGLLQYTFTRAGNVAHPLTVNFQVGGSAVAGNDYFTSGATSFNGQVGTISFAAGQTSAVFLVDPAHDPLVEPDENVQVDIIAGSGYTIGSPSGAGALILNDDPSATVTLTVEPTSVAEDGNGVLRYRFTRAGNTVTDLNVDFRVTGTAVAGQDYFTAGAKSFNGQVGRITIPSGQSSAVFLVSPADDAVVEPHETVKVELIPGRFYSNGTPGGVEGTILNDDVAPSITVTVDSPTVLEMGNGLLRYTFTRTGSTANALTVNFRAVGAAVAGQDYYTSGSDSFDGQVRTITFAAGQSNKVFVVSPIDDTEVEQPEDVLVNILPGSGYVSGTPSGASALIINGDPSTTVTVASDAVSVAEDGLGVVRFTFTRAGSTATDLQVNFRVVGTAVAGADFFTSGADTFNGQTGVITIPAGQSSKVFLVSPADDGEVEEDESIGVEITPGNTYLAGTPAGAGAVILNDDPGQSRPLRTGSVAGGADPKLVGATSAPQIRAGILPPPAIEKHAAEPAFDEPQFALARFVPIPWGEISERLLSGMSF